MKLFRAFFLVFLTAEAKDVGKSYNYGPSHCVSLSRSAAGTCVIETNCQGDSIKEFTFDFICTDGAGGKVQHSFGEGGFEAEESFDTGVWCTECSPVEGGVLATTGTATKATAAEATPSPEAVPPSTASFYGPGGCVATYRSPTGTCIMQTRCTGKDTSDYNFGLTCVESDESSTRHLFGVNSFDPEETFDTLVECQLCLGLDGEAVVARNLTDLEKSVTTLQEEMKGVQADVKEILGELKLDKTTTTEAPTEASDTEAEADGEADEPAEEADGEAEDAAAGDAELFLHKKKVAKHARAHAHHARVRKHHSHAVKHHRREPIEEDMQVSEDSDDDGLEGIISDSDLSLSDDSA
jgi:hypothetical protein